MTKQEAFELSRQLKVPYIETSAKLRMNIEESFGELVRIVRKFQAYERSTLNGAGDGADGSGGGRHVHAQGQCVPLLVNLLCRQ